VRDIFKQQIIGIVELDQHLYDVCATAEAQFDDIQSKLSIKLDRYLRLRDLTAPEKHEEKDWLPKKEIVEYRVSFEEIKSTVNEVFAFWEKKVRASIPHTYSVHVA
jgi:hypothetical protein